MSELDFGRNINLDKDDQDSYKKMQNTELFKGKDLKDIFFFAMTLGYKFKMREPLKKKYPLINATFSPREKWIISAICVEVTKDLQILENIPEMKSIAEEYANAGFRIIKNRFLEKADEDPLKTLERDIHNCMN